MNKADLKGKWAAYCDIDKLVNNTMALLTKYGHKNTEHGVCVLLDTYFTNKKPLIDMFAKSVHYAGNMRIVVDIELERQTEATNVRFFCNNFMSEINAASIILKDKDEDGKTKDDYVRTGTLSLKASDLLSDDFRVKFMQSYKKRSLFASDGFTIESHSEYDKLYRAMRRFGTNYQSTTQESTIDWLAEYNINGSYTVGMKTSRAFNRMCTQYELNTLPDYNKLFAKYSDMVSGLKRKLKFFISLNPLDYLTMSFGNSWSSCHTIDRSNIRDMPDSYSGMYCGGTLSYMLDGSSIITYVYNDIPKSIEEGKIYRNMFHYENGALIQARIYPQGNDGATDLYKEFRSVVQKEFADMLGVSNNWAESSRPAYKNISSTGVHYRDYECFSSCNMTYPEGMSNAATETVHIGHERICVNCGKSISDDANSKRLQHADCD